MRMGAGDARAVAVGGGFCMSGLKVGICTSLGIVGSGIAAAFGGWDAGLMTLVILMAIDYLTGFMVAAIWHKSPKSENGALESKAGWKGLCRKGVTLLIVLIGAQLDKLLGVDFVRNAVIIGYAVNELISIIENAGLMGVPVPAVVQRAIELLQKKGEDTDDA